MASSPAQRPAVDADGYTEGQRDRALVLDYIVTSQVCAEEDQFRHFVQHPAWALSAADVRIAVDLLIGDGLVRRFRNGPFFRPTSAGLAAHIAAQRALAAIATAIPA